MELAEMYIYLERWREFMSKLDQGIINREQLTKICDLKIFNMKTICELSDVPYQTFRDARARNFSYMSDDRVSRILKTIYTIVKYY